MAVVCVGCALVVVVVLLARFDLSLLLIGGGSLLIAFIALWVAVQFFRVRLLGDSVLVSAETFPDVQSAVDEVGAMVQYDGRVDIFVVPNLSPRIQLASYFGVRALLIEGGAVADMTSAASRPQLLFLLGTYFGGFKAKHDRWPITELVLDNAGIRKLLAPFVAPWLRATVYTGDQIAYACAGDFRVSLAAVYRLLVGRELSPQLAATGLILQAGRVSRSLTLRFVHLFRPVPHTTNRFLNVLRFAQQVDPDSVLAFRAELPHDVNGVLDESIARLARGARQKIGPALVTIGAILFSGIVLILGFQSTPLGAQGTAQDTTVEPTEVLDPPEVSDPPEGGPGGITHRSCTDGGRPDVFGTCHA